MRMQHDKAGLWNAMEEETAERRGGMEAVRHNQEELAENIHEFGENKGPGPTQRPPTQPHDPRQAHHIINGGRTTVVSTEEKIQTMQDILAS